VVRGYRDEICGECGRPVDQVWLASDALWRDVMGHEGGLLCIPCFEKKAGRFVRWIATVEEDAARPQGRAAQEAVNR
jgi:hypothetical protein